MTAEVIFSKVEAIFGEYEENLIQKLRGVCSSICYTESLAERELVGDV